MASLITGPLPKADDAELLILHDREFRVVRHFHTASLQFVTFVLVISSLRLFAIFVLYSAMDLISKGDFLSSAVRLDQDKAVLDLRVRHALQVVTWHIERHVLPRVLQVSLDFAYVLCKLGEISRI